MNGTARTMTEAERALLKTIGIEWVQGEGGFRYLMHNGKNVGCIWAKSPTKRTTDWAWRPASQTGPPEVQDA